MASPPKQKPKPFLNPAAKKLHHTQPLNHSQSLAEQLSGSKMLSLQKLRLQVSMHITNGRRSGQKEATEEGGRTCTQSQSLGERNRRAIFGRGRTTLHRDNLYHLKREKKQQISLLNSRKSREMTEDLHDLHRRSFTIKQLKPQRKQELPKSLPICNPLMGKTYGSYYQIVAIQKKFENSRYFFNDHPGYITGHVWEQKEQLGRRYRSRITNNPEHLRERDRDGKGKGYFEGGIIEPWKLHEDGGDGFY